jgi:cytochrome P450
MEIDMRQDFHSNDLRCGPTSDVALFDDEILLNPYTTYRDLRDQGSIVYLNRYQTYAVTRFDDVRRCLEDNETFSSSKVALNDAMSDNLRGTVLGSDEPMHGTLRRVVARPLAPQALQSLNELITRESEDHVQRLVKRGTFDGVADLARYLPLTVVSNLVGLSAEGRGRMLEWAAASFNAFGPNNQRTVEGFEIVGGLVQYVLEKGSRDQLTPGSWGAQLWDAADRGEIDSAKVPFMLIDYIAPSLDTTINATGNALWLFANNPDQWKVLRENPTLITNAINEIIRVESPIQFFARTPVRDVNINGVSIKAGESMLMMFASANRDERKWGDPERFDVRRRAQEQLGFGHGVHQCMGNNLARMEIRALLMALAKRVERFELISSQRALNNMLRGFAQLELIVR